MEKMENLPNGEENQDSENKLRAEEDGVDPWKIKESQDDGPGWKDMTCRHKFTHVLSILIKILILLGLVYLFICALSFLGNAFKLLGGKIAGQTFRESELLSNPVAGLMIGVIATVLLQSSSTTTSIIITMVGAKIIPIQNSIPMVMGANIGTSITNTLVSLAQSGDREEFRKAFGGATVHDMFNWLTVIILLPLEVATSYLYHLTGVIVESLNLRGSSNYKKDILKTVTKPFTNLIVKVNKNVIKDIAINRAGSEDGSVLKRWCGKMKVKYNQTVPHTEHLSPDMVNSTLVDDLMSRGINISRLEHENGTILTWNTTETMTKTVYTKRCGHLFALTNLSDSVVGVILLVMSLLMIVVSLIFIVKLLNTLLKSPIAKLLNRTINSEFPGKLAFLTGYVAIVVGAGVTMVIQSSSVFTSTLTPLVGVGILSIDRMLPLTLGANIGTTLTGILAALAAPAKEIPDTLRVALCHLFFNISGTLIFYPVPFMRKAPIGLAKALGNTTAKYRWFSLVYIIFSFILIPGFVFALSFAGSTIFMAVGIPLLAITVIIILINVAQSKCNKYLPNIIKDWNFMPSWMHSLKPYDKVLSSLKNWCCARCCRNRGSVGDSTDGYNNSKSCLTNENSTEQEPEANVWMSRDNKGFESEDM